MIAALCFFSPKVHRKERMGVARFTDFFEQLAAPKVETSQMYRFAVLERHKHLTITKRRIMRRRNNYDCCKYESINIVGVGTFVSFATAAWLGRDQRGPKTGENGVPH